jgi:putative nucleotidyltransferase with HDIG domain
MLSDTSQGPKENPLSIIEELWFGDISDEKAEALAAQSLIGMSAKVLGLHPFPPYAQQILSMSRNPDCNVFDLAKIIEQDPAFASRILRLVHSAAFVTSVKCTSINQAVGLLGTRIIGEMAASWAVLDFFTDDGERWIHLKEHVTTVSTIARHLAIHVGLPADHIYTCGLLHDIGKMFLLQDGEENYPALLDVCQNKSDALHLVERETYGYDHAVLGAHVLKAWEIPDPVPQIVAWHHQPARALAGPPEIARMVYVIRAANKLAYALDSDFPLEETIQELAQDESLTYLNLSIKDLRRLWPEVNRLKDEAAQLLGHATSDPVKGKRVMTCATCQQEAASLWLCVECGKPFCSSHGSVEQGVCTICTEAAKDRIELATRHDSTKRIWMIVGIALVLVVLVGMLVWWHFIIP